MFKKISIVVIALFLFGGSTFAFAWWDDLETSDDNITIGVGEGVTLEDVAAADFGNDSLVPSGVIEQEEQTDELANTYTLNVNSENEITDSVDLEITIDNVSTGAVDFADQVEFEVTGSAISVDTTTDSNGISVTLENVFNDGFFGDFDDGASGDFSYQQEFELLVRFIDGFENNDTFVGDREDIFNSDIKFDITFELTD